MTDQVSHIRAPEEAPAQHIYERPKDALSAVAAFHVDIDPSNLRQSGWARGPLPVSVTLNDTLDPDWVTATEVWRRNIVLPQAADLLYGGYHDVERWHLQHIREIAEQSDPSSIASMTGIGSEILLLPTPRKIKRSAVLLVHFDLNTPYPSDLRARCMVIAKLHSLTRDLLRTASSSKESLQWELPAALTPWIPKSCSAAPGYLNAFVGIHLLSHAGVTNANQLDANPQDVKWTDEDFWDWHLAMCSPPTRRQINNVQSNVPAEPGESLLLAQSKVRLTRLGFVQTSRVPTAKGTSHEALQDLRRFRTIYADAILLVMAQQRLLARLTEETCKVVDPARDIHIFQEVARDLRVFRNCWWLRDYTNWRQPDRLMRRFQEIIGLDENFNDLKDDHEFFASIAQATETTFFNRTLLALTFFSVISCVSAVLALFGDNLHQASMRATVLGAASLFFGAVTYLLLRRSGLTWRKR